MYSSVLYASRIALRASRSLIVPFRASCYSPKTSFGPKTCFRLLSTISDVSTADDELKKYNEMWKDSTSRYPLSGGTYLSVECIYSIAMLAVSMETLRSGVGSALGSGLGMGIGTGGLILCFLDWSGILKKTKEHLIAKYPPKEDCNETPNDRLELAKKTVEIMTHTTSTYSYLANVCIGSGIGAMIAESFFGGQNIVSTTTYMLDTMLMTGMGIVKITGYWSLYDISIKHSKT